MSIYGDLMNLNKAQPILKPEPPQPAQNGTPSPTLQTERPTLPKKKRNKAVVIPRHHDTTTPSMVSRHHDTIIEAIRVAVKVFGKEAATHRFTLEEKAAIANIVFTYKTQGVKTSENEVARIAINFVVNDYKENGENSVLHKAIQALNE